MYDIQDIQKNYDFYKKIINIIFDLKGNNSFKCKCGQTIKLSGVASHKVICKYAEVEKMNYILNYTNITKCITCGKDIKWSLDLCKNRKKPLYFCSSECKNKLKHYLNLYDRRKKCIICNKEFINVSKTVKTCSNDCYLILLSRLVKKYHKDNKGIPEYEERLLKFSKNAEKYQFGKVPVWNKGLHGREYLKHYEKEDGTNFYTILNNNDSFFKKTSIEIKIKKLLEELNFRYIHSFIWGKHQYDFYLMIDHNHSLILECDGDYWHKSQRRCNNIDEIQIQRLADNLKEASIIYEYNEKYKKIPRYLDVIRFWEYNINNNIEEIKNFLINIQDTKKYEKTISEIKEYYKKNS
jgi:hypothetical protein